MGIGRDREVVGEHGPTWESEAGGCREAACAGVQTNTVPWREPQPGRALGLIWTSFTLQRSDYAGAQGRGLIVPV
jgi:hypothetical protein